MVRTTDPNAENAQRANRAAQVASDKAVTDKKQAGVDDKLAATDSPSVARTDQGDWAKANNPSPAEQADETARTDAIRRVEGR